MYSITTIITAAGIGSRGGFKTPKTLLTTNNRTLLDRLLNDSLGVTYILTNGNNYKEFISYEDKVKIWSNKVKGMIIPGCLENVSNFIKNKRIKTDLLILTGSIIYNFDLSSVLRRFQHMKEIVLPIRLKSNSNSSGKLRISEEGKIISFVGGLYDSKSFNYEELGIYFIPKKRLNLLHDCVKKYKKDSIRYLIEYLFNKVPVYGIEVSGDWNHIVTIEDYNEIKNKKEYI